VPEYLSPRRASTVPATVRQEREGEADFGLALHRRVVLAAGRSANLRFVFAIMAGWEMPGVAWSRSSIRARRRHTLLASPVVVCEHAWEWLLWRGPIAWPHVRKTRPTLCWRASNSSTARTRPTAKTCSRSQARPHRRPRWSTHGPPNLGTTTTARTDVAVCAGTTPKSSGATPKKSDAQWREAEDARFGFATTIHQATGSASVPISRPPRFPYSDRESRAGAAVRWRQRRHRHA
jgi:hypothetical protein